MSKHTPGPWEIKRGNALETDIAPIATIVHWDITQEEKEANTRLIATAPELLEACKVLLKRIQFLGSDEARYYSRDNTHWIKLSKQAIAKAEGKK